MRELTEIKYELEGGIARVTINRPERLNALGMNLAEEFNALALELAEEKEVRVALLTGEGRAFSTGRDLKESATHTKEDADRYQLLGMEAVTRWENLPMPTIAAINGPTFGWGMEISLACDIRFVPRTPSSVFPNARWASSPAPGEPCACRDSFPRGSRKS